MFFDDDREFYLKAENRAINKLKDTQEKFNKLCIEYGAEAIPTSDCVQCRLLLISAWSDFSEDYIKKIKSNIKWEELILDFIYYAPKTNIGAMEMINSIGSSKYYVPDRNLFNIYMEEMNKLDMFMGLDIVERGLPYAKYPIFEEESLEIDYLIAMPSIIHFRGEQQEARRKYEFLRNIIALSNKFHVNDKVYIKHHNVRDKQRYYGRVDGGIVWLKIAMKICGKCAGIIPFNKIRNKFYDIAAHLAHSIIENKYPSLEKVSKYHNFNIELFLPYVRKGLVTGNSGTVFNALFHKLPVYNCDPQDISRYNSNSKYLQKYHVPFCNGKLTFDNVCFDLIPDKFRDVDMVRLIEQELS